MEIKVRRRKTSSLSENWIYERNGAFIISELETHQRDDTKAHFARQDVAWVVWVWALFHLRWKVKLSASHFIPRCPSVSEKAFGTARCVSIHLGASVFPPWLTDCEREDEQGHVYCPWVFCVSVSSQQVSVHFQWNFAGLCTLRIIKHWWMWVWWCVLLLKSTRLKEARRERRLRRDKHTAGWCVWVCMCVVSVFVRT